MLRRGFSWRVWVLRTEEGVYGLWLIGNFVPYASLNKSLIGEKRDNRFLVEWYPTNTAAEGW